MNNDFEFAGKSFCRIAVYDIETAQLLAVSERNKNVLPLLMVDVFRESIFRPFRKIRTYCRVLKIKNRWCLIVYWSGSTEQGFGSVVFGSGILLGLRGKRYFVSRKSESYFEEVKFLLGKMRHCYDEFFQGIFEKERRCREAVGFLNLQRAVRHVCLGKPVFFDCGKMLEIFADEE